MSKLKKILSRKFPEYFARYIHRKMDVIVTNYDNMYEALNKKAWDDKFKEKSSIFFEIEEDLKINLYKDSILSKLIYDGFEEEEVDFMRKVIKEGDTIIDIGANIGLFSLIASKIVGDTGKVISFEPSPVTYDRLLENIKLNNFENIDARNFGLSDKEGNLKLNISENGYDAWNTFANEECDKFQQSVEVKVTTLDKELSQENLDKISFIKIDVEGWEKFVLKGGEFFLKNNSPTVMIEFTESNTFAAGYFVHELYDIMESFGFKWYKTFENTLIEESKQLHYPYNNLIATKDISQLLKKMN